VESRTVDAVIAVAVDTSEVARDPLADVSTELSLTGVSTIKLSVFETSVELSATEVSGGREVEPDSVKESTEVKDAVNVDVRPVDGPTVELVREMGRGLHGPATTGRSERAAKAEKRSLAETILNE
jgi:hypothetical protein